MNLLTAIKYLTDLLKMQACKFSHLVPNFLICVCCSLDDDKNIHLKCTLLEILEDIYWCYAEVWVVYDSLICK